MRTGWVILASLLLGGPAHAAPVGFFIDLVLTPAPRTMDPAFTGSFPAAGQIFIEEDLLGMGDGAILPFRSLAGVFVRFPRSRAFIEDDFLFSTTCLAPPCGIALLGGQPQGFAGATSVPSFTLSDFLTLEGNSLSLTTGLPGETVQLLATGTLSFRAQIPPAGPAPVPEPSSWMMMGFGFGGLLAGWAHRRRIQVKAGITGSDDESAR